MKLYVSATAPLRPILERMSEHVPHEVVIGDSRTPLPESGYDAILLPDGMEAIGEGLPAAQIPLVAPLVHNGAALLLGSAERYRAIFERFSGGLCWMLPGCDEVQQFAPASCSQLGIIADTQHGVYTDELAAMRFAAEHELDAAAYEADTALLARLLGGDWQHGDILTAQPGQMLAPTYTRTLLTVG